MNRVDPFGLSDDEKFSETYAESLKKLIKKVKEAWDLTQNGKCPKNPCLSVTSLNAMCNCIFESKGDAEKVMDCICLISADTECKSKAKKFLDENFPDGLN